MAFDGQAAKGHREPLFTPESILGRIGNAIFQTRSVYPMSLPPLDLGLLTIILQLIFLEGILSFDNAAVLGAMVAPLPPNRPVPWPRALRPVGRLLDPILGPQQSAALKVGLLGAYLGRGLMLVAASFIIRNPWLQFIGAVYLIKIAVEHLGSFHTADEGAEEEALALAGKTRGFWATVLMVELMDLAFSLDNVVAAVALSDHIVVVMIGVALGILAMRFAAGIFAHLIEKEPILETAAYLLVLNIGIEFLLAEFAHLEFHELTRFAINLGTIVLTLVYAHTPWIQRLLSRPFAWIARGFFYLDRSLNLIWFPFQWLFRAFFHLLTLPFRRKRGAAPGHVPSKLSR